MNRINVKGAFPFWHFNEIIELQLKYFKDQKKKELQSKIK